MHTPVNLLLVDDEDRNLSALESILQSPDYRLVRAHSADEALHALVTDTFAVVVLDVRMPDMDGLELAQIIKQRKSTQHLPIIFLTAYGQEDEQVMQGYVAGAVDYLSKPCNPDILRSKIAVFVDLHRKTQQLAEQNVAIARANQEAQEARLAAERASHYKSSFLATMSHELRTPLNSIIGFTELLIDEKPGPLAARQREYLTDVLNSSRHLLRLINDVLDLAKVEAGKLELRVESFPVRAAVEGARAIVHHLAQKHGITVDLEVAADVKEVTLDQRRFKQVLYNLVSNAVKFTPERGRVRVTVRRLESGSLEVEVSDNGIGIKPEDLGRLFQEFDQLDTGLARRGEGTGLGLALTKRIVEFQGGRIGVVSTPGRGSIFSVVLPLPAEAKASP